MNRYLICILLLLSLTVAATAQESPEPLLIDDFEIDELITIQDEFDNELGYLTASAAPESISLRLTNSFRAGESTTALFIRYEIEEFGSVNHIFTDGESLAPQDWSSYNALSFWFSGGGTGEEVQFDIFDNLNPNSTSVIAERFSYRFVDDSRDWRYIEIPFRAFERNTTAQPLGAPDDGLSLDAVTGYGIALPVGEGRVFLDEVQVSVVNLPDADEDTASLDAVTSIEIDESITWESREWDLLWSDEFNEEAGTPINDEFWTCEEGGWGWGNNEAQFYTCRTENAAHDGDGNLVITAIEENLDGSECWYGNCSHTSARLITQDKVEFTYGRVEARIKLPQGAGMWPAFWMLGADFPEIGWPDSGEIDIMENIGSEPRTVHGTIHGPGYSAGAAIGNSYRVDEPLTDNFHIFAIDWDPYVIRWYLDGELYGTLSINDIRGNRWAFNHDFFLLMNIAVGGNWPGYPPPTTEFPQRMLVDYVRVYQLAD